MPDYPIAAGRKRRFKHAEVVDLVGALEFANATSYPGTDQRIGHAPRHLERVALTVSNYPGRSPYPKQAYFRVKFPVLDCPGVIVWRFMAVDRHEPSGTTIRARLHDGTTEKWWDGAAWSDVADEDTDFNTLADVSAHLPDWDPDSPLGFVFGLRTDDAQVTPSLRGFRVVYDIDLPSEFNDWVYEALVGAMQDDDDGIHPVKDAAVLASGTTSLDWGAALSLVEDSWDFGVPIAVFDNVADPWKRTNILSSYNSGTRIATLTTAPAAGRRLTVRLRHTPKIVVNTDPDHVELAASPAVILDRIEVIDLGEAPDGDSCVNEFVDPPTAEVWPAARHVHLAVAVTITAPLSVDLHRLGEAVTSWLNDRRVLRSPTTGDLATMRITDQMAVGDPVPRSGLRTGVLAFRLEHVYLQTRETVAGYGVRTIQVEAHSTTGDSSDEIEIGG